MRVPPSARHDRSETCTPRAARVTPPRPRPAEGRRRAAQVCAAIGASRSLQDLHAPCSSCDTTTLPGYGRRRAGAGPHMYVLPSARRDRCETCTPRAARATRPPSPATAGGGPAPSRTDVCRHRRVKIAARPAHPVQLARRNRPPRPRPAEGRRRAAHACAAIGASRSRRELHVPCSSREATALPGGGGPRRVAPLPHPLNTWCCGGLPATRESGPARRRDSGRARPSPRPLTIRCCGATPCAASGSQVRLRAATPGRAAPLPHPLTSR
jgi:hypothetical protein